MTPGADAARDDMRSLRAAGSTDMVVTRGAAVEALRPAHELSSHERTAARWRLSWLDLAVACALAGLYGPVLVAASRSWFSDSLYAYCVYIFPMAGVLVWANRRAAARIERAPSLWGLPVLAVGLGMELTGYVLDVQLVTIASLAPVLAGAILCLYGTRMWRLQRFAVCFLLFAAPLPGSIVGRLNLQAQLWSTEGSVSAMRFLGLPVTHSGNMVDVPGAKMEVAQVCSGFRLLEAIAAFGAFYGYIYGLSRVRGLTLAIAALPIALFANVMRLSALMCIGARFGQSALERAHAWAEPGLLVFAYCMFVCLGKALGCRTLRLSV